MGVGKSTVGVLAVQACEAINTVVYPRVVGIRNVQEIIAGFHKLGFLNCARAIDGTHILIVCSLLRESEYVN